MGLLWIELCLSVCAFVIGYDQRSWARSYAGGLHLRWGFHSRSCWELRLGEKYLKAPVTGREQEGMPFKAGTWVCSEIMGQSGEFIWKKGIFHTMLHSFPKYGPWSLAKIARVQRPPGSLLGSPQSFSPPRVQSFAQLRALSVKLPDYVSSHWGLKLSAAGWGLFISSSPTWSTVPGSKSELCKCCL